MIYKMDRDHTIEVIPEVNKWRPTDKFYPTNRQVKKLKTNSIVRFSVIVYYLCLLVFTDVNNLMAHEQFPDS